MNVSRPAIFAYSMALSALLLSSPARSDEPEPVMTVDEGAYPPPPVRTKLLLAGVGMTGAFYGGAVGASYLWESDPGASDLRLPFVGPWMKLGQTTLCTPEAQALGCNDFIQVGGAVLAALSGLGQLAGTGFVLEALFMKTAAPSGADVASLGHARSVPTRERPDAPLTFRKGELSVTPVPLFGAASQVGISLLGSF